MVGAAAFPVAKLGILFIKQVNKNMSAYGINFFCLILSASIIVPYLINTRPLQYLEFLLAWNG
jgi:hypothetical protein